jgi:hypothetical protein
MIKEILRSIDSCYFLPMPAEVEYGVPTLVLQAVPVEKL